MIDNGHALVGFLPLFYSEDQVEQERIGRGDDILVYGSTSSTTVPLKRVFHVTEDSERMENRMRVLQEAFKVVMRALQE